MSQEKVKKPVSLTELTETVQMLSVELGRHTEGRTYLYQILTGEKIPPEISISAPPLKEGDPVQRVVVNSRVLGGETAEIIFAALADHEEKLAIACWEQIYKASGVAIELIKQMQQHRAKQLAEAQKEDEFPATIPMTRPEAES